MSGFRNPFLVGALALSCASACGSEQPSTARIEPMGPEAEASQPVRTLVDVPGIDRVRFEPDSPLAGRAAAVVVDVEREVRDMRLEYVWSIGGRRVETSGKRVDLSTARPGDRLLVTVTPFVGEESGVPISHAVRLRSPAPRVLGVSFEPPMGLAANAEVEARPMVDDGNPHRMGHRFQWLVNGRRLSAYESTFSTEGLRRGDKVQVEVIAHSDGERSEPFLSEEIELVNGAPRLETIPLALGEDGALDVRLQAPDPDGDTPVAFELLKGPEGLELSRNGKLSWPAASVRPGHHAIEIELSDPLGAKRKTGFSLDIGSPAAPASG